MGVRDRRVRRGDRPRPRGRSRAPAHDEPPPRVRGTSGGRAHDDERGRSGIRRALVDGPRPPGARERRRGDRTAGPYGGLLAGLAQPGLVPGPSVGQCPATERPRVEGLDLRPDGRAPRRGHHLAARAARRPSQLGLPLQLGPRLHLRALGPLHARFRLRGEQFPLLHAGPDPGRASAPDHVRDRRGGTPLGVHAGSPDRLRTIAAGPDRQRGVRAAPARRLGSAPRLGLPPHEGRRVPERRGLGEPRAPGGGGGGSMAPARPRHLGGSRRAQALHDVEDHVLGGVRPRCAPRRGDGSSPRSSTDGTPWPRRSGPTSSRTG